MTSDKKMIPAVSVPVETATDSVSNGTQSLVTVQFSRLSQLLNTWAEANDFQTPKWMTQAFDYSKDTGKTVYANVNARLIAQLATVAAIAKLATFLLWFLVMLAPALNVIGNFAFLLFGAIAIVKLTQSGAAFVTKSAIPFITQPPAAFDDDASKGVEVSLPA